MRPLGKRLGDLLVEAGYITPEQLQKALERQEVTGQRPGKVLVELGYVTEQDIIQVLEFQLGIPHISLYKHSIDPEVARSIPYSIARRHQVLPIKRSGNKLTLAMVDPLNVVAIDEVRLLTEAEVEPVIATEEEINQAISWYFGVREQVDKVLKSLQEEQGVTTEDPVLDPEGLREIVEEAPIVQAVNSLFHQALQERASDIHLEVQGEEVRVRYRVDGILREVITLPHHIYAPILTRIKIMAGMDIAEKRLPQDGRIQIKVGDRDVDLRVSTLPTITGEKIAIRVLDKSSLLLRLNQLGFSKTNLEKFRRMIRRPYGIILVTGPTGSGKTTTLYATLQELNSTSLNIVTIEDPVEYRLEGINQVQINSRAGLTFASGLRAILRQDPNIIMVGEIRDGETADIAVRAALTGHLVLSTLHTNDAPGALTRLLSMGVEPYLVASAVIGVVAQRLVRLICPHCKTLYQVPPGARERLALGMGKEEPLTLYRGQGCPYCNRTGYRGRLAIHEVMPMNRDLEQLVLEKAPVETLRSMACKAGMISLQEDGFAKVREGLTTLEEVLRVA